MAKQRINNNEYDKDMNIRADAINLVSVFTDKHYDGSYSFDVSEDEKYVRITFDNVTLELQLYTDAHYPDTSKIIPQSFKTEVKVNTKEILEELKVLREVAAHNKKKMIKIDVTGGKMKLIAKSDINKLISEIDSVVVGEDILVAANIDFVMDALKTSNRDFVTFRFTNENNPFMIDEKDLILPFRLSDRSEAV